MNGISWLLIGLILGYTIKSFIIWTQSLPNKSDDETEKFLNDGS